MESLGSVFLGGPIQHAYQNNSHTIEHLRHTIQYLIQELEHHDFQVFSAHIAEKFGEQTPHNSEMIVRRDFQWMQKCDVFVALFLQDSPSNYIQSDGTHIEIGWASALRKPIVFVGNEMPSRYNTHLVRGLSAISQTKFLSLNAVMTNPQLLIECICKHLAEPVKAE